MPRTPNYGKFDLSRASGRKDTLAYKILDIKSNLDIPEYGVFNQTMINEIDSLENRHIGLNRRITGNDMAKLQQQYDKLGAVLRDFDYKPLTIKQLLSDKRGPLRRRYLNAYLNLKKGFKPRSDVQGFIKLERFTKEKLDTKPARMIQHRSYEYLYILNKYLKPIDKYWMTCKDVIDGQEVWSYFGKGKSGTEICNQMYDLWCEFKTPVGACVDQSHFDGHYNEDLHRAEHSMYYQIPEVKQNCSGLLKKQVTQCKGTTQCGVRYKINGERCSGEYNTSMGNSGTNISIIKQVMEDCKIVNYRIIVNGDDSVIFMEQDDLVQFNIDNFKKYGMDPKLDKVAREFEEIEFCQCSPVKIGDGWKLVRDPLKTIGKSQLMLSNYSRSVQRYVASIGLCELALSSGVPMMQAFALKLIALSNGARPLDQAKIYRSKFEPSLTLQPVEYHSRLSFERAFNISVSEQLQFEKDMGASINLEFLDKYILKHKNYHQK